MKELYKVTQTQKGYIKSISYQEAIETAKLYHGNSGQWRACPVDEIEED